MKTIYIDFTEIGDYEDFYTQLKEKITLPKYFGDNLDAFSHIISGGNLKMPLHIEFVNVSLDQLEIFEELLASLEDLEDKVKGFSFTYYLEQYEENQESK